MDAEAVASEEYIWCLSCQCEDGGRMHADATIRETCMLILIMKGKFMHHSKLITTCEAHCSIIIANK